MLSTKAKSKIEIDTDFDVENSFDIDDNEPITVFNK
jgi:hypothetical protein